MCLTSKTLGWIKIIGALLAGYFAMKAPVWSILILALVVLVSGINHVMEKKGKR